MGSYPWLPYTSARCRAGVSTCFGSRNMHRSKWVTTKTFDRRPSEICTPFTSRPSSMLSTITTPKYSKSIAHNKYMNHGHTHSRWDQNLFWRSTRGTGTQLHSSCVRTCSPPSYHAPSPRAAAAAATAATAAHTLLRDDYAERERESRRFNILRLEENPELSRRPYLRPLPLFRRTLEVLRSPLFRLACRRRRHNWYQCRLR